MKPLSIILFCSLPILCFGQNIVHQNFSIFFPSEFPSETENDVINLLNNGTSGHWSLVPESKDVTQGIVLDYKNNPAFKKKESFRLQSDGSTLLTISSSSTEGLIFGMYKYLRSLGFKFYLPDDLYTITPAVKNPFGSKRDVIDEPFRQIRDFYGTGGFGSGKTDPGHSVEKSWKLWKVRNGFGAAYHLSGHRGEDFILENKTKLQQNPNWLVSPLTGNSYQDMTIKLNYLNKDAVDYYTDWTIKPLLQSNYKLPPANHSDFVSIEPSDGGGYLNDFSQNARKGLPSISDQVYGAANVAGQKLDKLFPNNPNIGVNLYAYNTHAEPPSFPLHPRVFVQLVPYQFQNIAYGPAFIKLWSLKVKRFALYDYFKYPDSHWDMPAGYLIDELMKRAFQAGKAGSEGTTYETSYSKFATAIPLWVLNQYLTNGDKSWQKNYEQLITDLYGKASPDIQKLFFLFYHEPKFDVLQLNSAANYLRQAEKTNKDQTVSKRLNELKFYLVYAYFYIQSQDLKNGTLEERLLPLEKIAWTLYQLKIIDSYRIMQLVSYAFLNANPPDVTLDAHYKKVHLLTFPDSDDPDAFWKRDYTYSSREIADIFNRINSSGTVGRIIKTLSISDQIKASKSIYKPKSPVTLQGDYTVRGYFTLFTEKPASITINWALSNDKGDLPTSTISGTDKQYEAVYDYPLKGKSGTFTVSIPGGESYFFISAARNTTYTIKLELGNVYCYFESSPRGKINFLTENGKPTYDPTLYPSYLFIPQNVNDVQYKVKTNALQIIDPDGKTVPTKLISQSPSGFELRSFSPPFNQQGKFWKAVITGNYDYEFLNIPDVYFLFQEK